MITVTCITSQLDLRAGTNGEASCSCSGSTKLANAIEINPIGVIEAATIGEDQDRSTSNCIKVLAQDKKQSDSYKLLTGKCPDCHHLKINCAVKQRLETATNKLTLVDGLSLPTVHNASGKVTSSNKKATRPKPKTGSINNDDKPFRVIVGSK